VYVIINDWSDRCDSSIEQDIKSDECQSFKPAHLSNKPNMGANRIVIYYSEKTQDETFEYRYLHFLHSKTTLTAVHQSLNVCLFDWCRSVSIPHMLVPMLPKNTRLLTESEWRAIGIQQSRGWEHFMSYANEPHILPFRRRL
jgi:cyclin-dependent kinase regulatory subunit CKS1